MNPLGWYLIGIVVVYIFLVVYNSVMKSKCPLCGSPTVDSGYDEYLHCTECPWSKHGPDFEFAEKHKVKIKKYKEDQERMYKIAEEVKEKRKEERL
jgi:ribosomal protein L37AE/L43A